MAIDYGGQQTVQIGGLGCLISKRLLGPLEGEAKRAQVGCSYPKTEQGSSRANKSITMAAQMPYWIATHCSIFDT